MKRYLIVGMLFVLVFLGGVKFGVSYFTDVAKSKNNEISTGDFDIGISKDGSRYYDELRLFSFEGMEPGEERSVEFHIKNRGDYPISRIEMVLNVTDIETKISKAEAGVDTTPERGELSRYLRITEANVTINGEAHKVSDVIGKTLFELNSSSITIFTGKLKPEESVMVAFRVQLSPEAGNECLTDKALLNVEITGSQ